MNPHVHTTKYTHTQRQTPESDFCGYMETFSQIPHCGVVLENFKINLAPNVSLSNIVNFKSTATTKISLMQWPIPLILGLRR